MVNMKNKRCWGCHGDARKVCDIRHVWCGYKDRTKCPDFFEMTEDEWNKLCGVLYDEQVGESK